MILFNIMVSSSMFFFCKLQARSQGAKVTAVTAVVTGKEVESEAITLHRELQCERE